MWRTLQIKWVGGTLGLDGRGGEELEGVAL